MIQCPVCMHIMVQYVHEDKIFCYCKRCHNEHVVPINAVE